MFDFSASLARIASHGDGYLADGVSLARPGRDAPLRFMFRVEGLRRALLQRLDPGSVHRRDVAEALCHISLCLYFEATGRDRRVSYSRNRNHYARRGENAHLGFTHAAVTRAVDHLAATGLIDHVKARPGCQDGLQSTMRARPDLIDIVADLLDGHAPTFRPQAPVLLRDAQGRSVPLPSSAEVRQMRRQVERVTEALDAARIEGPASADFRNRHLRRIFNVDFGHGGRWYDRGAWQTLPKACRSEIRIDGEDTVELDFGQLHPRLLYARLGEDPGGDLYDIGLSVPARPVVKCALNILINAETKRQALFAIAAEIARQAPTPYPVHAVLPEAARLLMAIEHRHARIANHFGSGVGLALQFEDSEIAHEILAGLIAAGTIALPIHDSFRIAASQRTLLAGLMAAAAERRGVLGACSGFA